MTRTIQLIDYVRFPAMQQPHQKKIVCTDTLLLNGWVRSFEIGKKTCDWNVYDRVGVVFNV